MNYKWLIMILTVLFTIPQLGHSQNNPSWMADQLATHPTLAQAREFEMARDFTKAAKLYKHAYLKNMGRQAAIEGYTRCLKDMRKYNTAEEFLLNEIKENSFDFIPRIALVDFYLDIKKYDPAKVSAEQGLKIHAGNLEFTIRYAKALHYLGQHIEAVAIFDQYLKSRVEDGEAFKLRGRSRADLGQHAAAEVDYKKALSFRPFDHEIHHSIAQINFAKKDYKAAIASAEECNRINKDFAPCYDVAGDAYTSMGHPDKAYPKFATAVSYAPLNKAYRLKWCVALASANEWIESDRQFRLLLTLDPKYSPGVRGWVNSLSSRHLYDLVSSHLVQFNRLVPTDVWVAVQLSELMRKAERFDEAEDIIEKAAKKSKDPAAQFQFAHVLMDNDEAKQAIKVIGEINKDYLGQDYIHYNLGLVYKGMGKWSEALGEWAKIEPSSTLYYKAKLGTAVALDRLNRTVEITEALNKVQFPQDIKSEVDNVVKLLQVAKPEEVNRAPSTDSYMTAVFHNHLVWEAPQL